MFFKLIDALAVLLLFLANLTVKFQALAAKQVQYGVVSTKWTLNVGFYILTPPLNIVTVALIFTS